MSAIRNGIAVIVGGGLFLAVPAAAQTLGQGGGPEISWVRVIAALLFCLALAVGAALALRHRFRGSLRPPPTGERRLRLIETIRLSHQTDLCLLELDGQPFLFAASAHGGAFHPVSRPEAEERP